jgi:hypothetical protein
MARKSQSVALAVTMGAVFFVLLLVISAIASDSSLLHPMPALAALPVWLKFCASVVGAAVAISVLVHFTLKVWGPRDQGSADVGVWLIAFLAALTLWETHWATVLALTLLTITHLVLAFFSQYKRPLPPVAPHTPVDDN